MFSALTRLYNCAVRPTATKIESILTNLDVLRTYIAMTKHNKMKNRQHAPRIENAASSGA